MSDMRLIVAGAGGRMGRTLLRALHETEGATVVGALEAPDSELLGEDSGVLAGLAPNGIPLSADLWTLSKDADGILDFTVPAATIANVAIAAERGLVHVIGTTGLSASDNAVIKIGLPGEKYLIDLDYCKGCGLCVSECPAGAIQMVPEEI